MIKMTMDNDVTNHIDAACAKNETELLGSIGLGTVCDDNKIEQRLDQLYRCGICQKWNWTIMKDRVGYGLW